MALQTRPGTGGINVEAGEPASAAPRRILMLSTAGELGGAERSYLELLRHLPRAGLEIHACVPPDSPLARLSALQPVALHTAPMRRLRRSLNPFALAGQFRALRESAKQIAAICRAQRIGAIHANTDSAAVLAWEATRETKLPFVWHCRDLRPMHGLARTLGGAAAAVVVISKTVRAHLLREGVPEEKLRLIYNGIETERFHTAEGRAAARLSTRRALGIPAERPVVLCAAAYVPWKRIEHFYESLCLLRERMPAALGVLAGSDLSGLNARYERALERKRKQLALGSDALLVLRQREDMAALMAAADVLVSCSENEPFGRVLVEAGAAGLPVVATHSGAGAEIVVEGESGLLVPPGNTAAIAAACESLLRNAELREKLGEGGRRIASERFHAGRTATELGALLEQAANAVLAQRE